MILLGILVGALIWGAGAAEEHFNWFGLHKDKVEEQTIDIIITPQNDCRFLREFKGQKHWIGEDCNN